MTQDDVSESARIIKGKIHVALFCNSHTFPVKKPVPLRLHHLRNLDVYSEYIVTDRKEGIEVLLYHGPEGLFWYGKDGKLRPLPLEHLPTLSNDDEITIAEAVFVHTERSFFVSDSPIVKGVNQRHKDITERVGNFEALWLQPLVQSQRDKIKICIQTYYFATDLLLLQEHYANKSLILGCRNSYYSCGKDIKHWEWQDPKTINVNLRIRWKHQNGAYIGSLWALSAEEDRETQFCELSHMTCTTQPSIPDGSIVECHYDHEKSVFSRTEMTWTKGLWTPLKCKTDKLVPDQVKSIWSRINTIRENISFDNIAERFSNFQRLKEDAAKKWEDVEMY